MKVEAIRYFEDLKENVDRNPGDVWEVDEKRFEALNSTPYGEFVRAVDEPKPAKAEKTRKQEA